MRLVQALRRWKAPAGSTANIVGIVLVTTGGGAGTWQRIDKDGNALTTTPAFFNAHPTYAGIVDETIDSQSMVKVPAFYVKGGTVASGAYAGKRAWWISDQATAGFALHPAFMSAGNPLAQFWIGKYQGTADGAKLGSQAGLFPVAAEPPGALQARAAARNAGSFTGFSLWSYYQLQAIQVLIAIETGGVEVQTSIGRGKVDASGPASVNDAVVLQASWRGITGLWGNVSQAIEGVIRNSSGVFVVWDKSGNKSFVATSQMVPAAGTTAYPTDFSAESSTDYDFSICFLPSYTTLGTTAPASATIPDAMTGGSGDTVMAHVGGFYGNGSLAGLFYLAMSLTSTTASPAVGTRLSKI